MSVKVTVTVAGTFCTVGRTTVRAEAIKTLWDIKSGSCRIVYAADEDGFVDFECSVSELLAAIPEVRYGT